jgi:hypothetical protein
MRIWKQQYILWHCSKPAFGRVFGNSSISFDIAANLRLDVYLETAISPSILQQTYNWTGIWQQPYLHRYCSKPTFGRVFGNSHVSFDVAVNLHLNAYLETTISLSLTQ